MNNKKTTRIKTKLRKFNRNDIKAASSDIAVESADVVVDSNDVKTLSNWFLQNQRPLPWRQSKDPYRIWISEVMLQQTTVAAVIPYYEKFLQKFPTVQKLAESSIENVYSAWAGLGYYSRARNIHKAAQVLKEGFPRQAVQLIELPGFGPYTSAAVSSIAFEDSVGVLDGNVIRVLSRKYALSLDWWNSLEKKKLQEISNQWAQLGKPSVVNQALMELGATICTPQKPQCLLCPLLKSCASHRENLTEILPKAKPRRASEIWVYETNVILNRKKIAMVKNESGPFLKNQWIFPGQFKKLKLKPKKFHVRHSITHHDIYIQIQNAPVKLDNSQMDTKKISWVNLDKVSELNPSSLLQKILKHKIADHTMEST